MLTRSIEGELCGILLAIQPLVPVYVTWYQGGSPACLAVAVSLVPWGIVASSLPLVFG